MKFDKETLIVITISFVILIAWEPLAKKMGWLGETPAVKTEENQTQNTKTPEDVATPKLENQKADKTTEAVVVDIVENLPSEDVTIQNSDISVKFNKNYSAVDSIVFKKFLNDSKTAPIVVNNDYELQGGMLNLSLDTNLISSIKTTLTDVKENGCTVIKYVKFKNDDQILIKQTFALTQNYLINSTINIKNLSKNQNFEFTPKVWAGDLQSWSVLSGDTLRTDKFVYSYFNPEKDLIQIDGDAKEAKFLVSPAAMANWSAISNKFFAMILKSDNGDYHPVVTRKLLSEKSYLLSFYAQFKSVKLEPNGSVDIPLTYYVGPKENSYLTEVAPECTQLIKLSWGPLNYLAKGLLWFLIKLKGICGSYGWSIIILTIIVRLLFWPVTQKANSSMKKMQALKPKIDKLREQYKSNPQMLNTKTMELYRQEGVNPVGGCLPILLQIPVFFALYATLEGAFALRQVPFLWAHNLAAPDTIFSFPLGFTVFGISNFDLNPLVIAMTLTMVLQQRLTPTAMEPMQQKMMTLMPLFMLIFLYELPSGLTLYWTVSQVFSILQLLLQRKLDNKKKVAS